MMLKKTRMRPQVWILTVLMLAFLGGGCTHRIYKDLDNLDLISAQDIADEAKQAEAETAAQSEDSMSAAEDDAFEMV